MQMATAATVSITSHPGLTVLVTCDQNGFRFKYAGPRGPRLRLSVMTSTPFGFCYAKCSKGFRFLTYDCICGHEYFLVVNRKFLDPGSWFCLLTKHHSASRKAKNLEQSRFFVLCGPTRNRTSAGGFGDPRSTTKL